MAKPVPSYKAVYAIDLPKGVLMEWAEMIVSSGEIGEAVGNKLRVAVTPAVMLS